jgi:hypothetical protein
MSEVEDHAELDAAIDEAPPQFAQTAGPGLGRAVREGIASIPCEREHPHP